MGNIIFNIAKGRTAHYGTLPGASDSLVVVPLLAAGLENDSVLVDKDTLADVLSGTTDEHPIGRRSAATVTVTVDDSIDKVDVDLADVVWTGATGAPIGALLICYRPTSTSTDAQTIPMSKHDFAITPTGGNITAVIPTTGIYRIS